MSFKEFYKIHQPELIKHIYANLDQAYQNYPLPVGAEGIKIIRKSVAQGKMIRGMLVLMSAHMHGITIKQVHYDLAAAVEILHTGFLIHDDIMDNDYKRRNQDSVYYQYIKEGRRKKAIDPDHYGTSMAMCLGDMVFFLVFEIISKKIKDPELVQCIIGYISQEVQHIGPAQMMDAAYGLIPKDPTEKEIDLIYTFKTAHYTFSLPLILGAVFSSYVRLPLLKDLGCEMGIIFQLRDDELGIFGDTKEIGKLVGSDIRENKKTLIRHILCKRADNADRKKLDLIFGNSALKKADITFVRNVLKRYKVMDLIDRQIEIRQDKVEQYLTELTSDGLDVSLLRELLAFIISRNK